MHPGTQPTYVQRQAERKDELADSDESGEDEGHHADAQLVTKVAAEEGQDGVGDGVHGVQKVELGVEAGGGGGRRPEHGFVRVQCRRRRHVGARRHVGRFGAKVRPELRWTTNGSAGE